MKHSKIQFPKEPSWLSRYRAVVNDEGYELMGAYVAGVFDATSSVSVSVTTQRNTLTGYTIVPRIQLQRQQRDLIGVVDEWALEHGVNGTLRERETSSGIHYKYTVQSRDDVEQLLKLIEPFIVVKHDTIQIILNEVLPRLRDGVHRDKEGFIETMEYVDMVRESTKTKNYKYDADYFREEWSDEL